MSNMSYCRFENTLADLRDCYDALGESGLEDLSPDERRAAESLLVLCQNIAGDFEDEIEALAERRREARRG